MTRFRYKAFDRIGTLSQGALDAATVQSVLESVRAKGLTPFEIVGEKDGSEKWWKRELFSGKKMGQTAVASFTRDLAILLQAQIIIGDALRILSDQTSDKKISGLTDRLHEEVVKGRPLSDALLSDQAGFGDDYVSMVRAGEQSGSVADVFAELASLYERRIEIANKMKSALIYPAVLTVIAFVSVGVICSVLVPNVAPIFIENGKPLPPFIAILMAVRDNAWIELLSLGAAIGAAAMLRNAVRRSANLKLRWHAAQLRLPVVGLLVLHRETARFSRTLATLMKAGVPIVSGIMSANAGVSNARIEASLGRSLEALREGASLATALKNQKVFPTLAVHMIGVGEETGQLPQLLLRVAVLFEEQSGRRIDRLMSLLMPLLTITIAALVGGLVMSVMTAILSINDLATS